MTYTVASVFDAHCANLKIDAKLAKLIADYQISFTTKNEDHINFFGGNLLGVDVVKFTPTDRLRWFEQIMRVEEDLVMADLLKVPTIDPEYFIVASDAMNNACVWLAYKFLTAERGVDKRVALDAATNCLLVMNYKFMTSLLHNYFRYPADKEVAQATYASLSGKYDIKRYGSWGALFRARVADTIAPNSPHYKTIMTMAPDEAVRYLINDSQGRIRSMVRNIMSEHVKRNQEGAKVKSQGSVVEINGEQILRDRTTSIARYTRYISSIMGERNSFMKEDLMEVIENIMRTMQPRYFRQTLEWMSNNTGKKAGARFNEVVEKIIIHAFGYLYKDRRHVQTKNNLAKILDDLKGTYGSSRGTDPILLELRSIIESFVIEATRVKHAGSVSSVRTGVLLYIVLRALAMEHYQGSARFTAT